jgi:tetratricopeptide (TPR) repeat protein/transglutaminase-like putative cysteine protease
MRNLFPAFFCPRILLVCILAASASSQQSGPPASESARLPATEPAVQSGGQTTPKSQAKPLAPQAKNGVKLSGPIPFTKVETVKDYSQEAYVIERLQNHYRFEADGTGRKESIARVRVQSEAGVQQWGQLQLGYNSANERMEIAYVRVLKEDGSVVKAPEDAIQDLSAPVEHEAPVYTDYRQKHVTVPGLRPGEILEYDLVTVVHTALAPGQFWAEYEFDKNDIILDEDLDVDVPSDRPLKLKNKPGMDPKITEANGRRVYHWTSSHLEREDDKDKDKDKAKDKKKKRKKPDDDRPDVQLTTFASWEQIGRWYADLEKDRRAPSAEVRAKADELTKGLSSDLDKTEGLYDYVAKNFRYVSLSLGVGRYQPHSAGDVLHNQYGDCKDKHTLLASLLEAEGLHADSVLINSSRKLDPDMPSPSQFDHVITMLPVGEEKGVNEEVWMDTTSEVAPFRLLSFSLRKKQALVIPPVDAHSGVAPHLEETPADTPMPDTEISEIEGKINQIGKLEAHVHYVFRGDEELMLRSVFRRVPQANWQRVVENVNAGIGGDITNLKVSDPAATREAFTMSYDVSRVNYLDWSKKKTEMVLPLSSFSLPEVDEDDTDADSEVLKLGPKAEYTYKIKLELPAKYNARAPLPFSLKRDYAEYQATYQLEGSVFTAGRKLTLRESELPAVRAPDYASFRRAVNADLVQQLSIENTVAGTPTPPADMKADDLVESGRAAMNSGDLTMAIEVLKRATEIDPKNKIAWNLLGMSYLGTRQDDAAIVALQKQIEINPYDEYAYNNLGRVYWQDRKYDDAVTAFHKQLEINPLDKFAHSNLGQMYAEWHKYDEAAAELEKAASLTPESGTADSAGLSAGLQVSLGDAYLNLGQDDKALAAFDHAVELSATPLVWNNIAYQLSLKKAHLDKAQQYAESAVSATAAALRNVSLDRLTQQELPLVSSLIAYWDTLGWIHFVEGDLDKAEKYVSAAWGLGHHGEVGDHLGQIYEKKGKKDRALETYALSMNGLRPTPETRDRLSALAGGGAKADAAVANYKQELEHLRTVDLGKVAKVTGNAEFFVLLSGGGGSAAKVESVKFLSGEEKLKPLSGVLRTADFHLTFPDDTPVKVLRRGTLSCSSATGNCSFLLMLPDDVRTVD